ncbi:MAG: 4-hydroxy-tetrahydrodipicolinate reductase [Actinomycetota bacterium]|nr:4-hydroxy-tetrahydrodipicolinate reductase [Actinomycetota bacterium]
MSGALGAVGRELVHAIAVAPGLSLQSAVARREIGRDVGDALGVERIGVAIEGDIERALDRRPDVLIDYTHPVVIRRHVALALERRVPVVIGTTGLFDEDFAEIDAVARAAGVGVATGNFSLTAALLQHLGRIAARHVPRFEVIEQGPAEKPDVPSGTARELAEVLARERGALTGAAVELIGPVEARGAQVGGVPVHSLRLPGTSPTIEVVFGAPGERLTIRHEEQGDKAIFVDGTLLAARRIQSLSGVVRGLDSLLFES